MLSRHERCTVSRTTPDNHVNYWHLTSPKRQERLSRLCQIARAVRQKITHLTAHDRLEEATKHKGEVANKATHVSLHAVMEEKSAAVQQRLTPDSLAHLFWDQQMKVARTKITIRNELGGTHLWLSGAFTSRHLSNSSYEALRQSGCISLPLQFVITRSLPKQHLASQQMSIANCLKQHKSSPVPHCRSGSSCWWTKYAYEKTWSWTQDGTLHR